MPKDSPRDWPAVRVTAVLDAGSPLRWLQGLSFHWPQPVLRSLSEGSGPEWGSAVAAGRELRLHRPEGTLPWTNADRTAALDAIAYTSRPLSSRLPFSYQKVPPFLRTVAAASLLKLNRLRLSSQSPFPSWPLDLSLDSLSDISAWCEGSMGTPPFANTAALTHDIDNPEALRYLPHFLALEERMGIRSTIFVVPNAWDLDHGVLRRAFEAGHEIGVHGFNHDNKTPFLQEVRIRERLESCGAFVERYGIRGYRSPSLLRSPLLSRLLAEYFSYDSSVPTAAAAYSSHGNGCATARPFPFHGLLQVPLTLPPDATLRFSGFSPSGALALWTSLSDVIRASGGMASLLTHCEPRHSGASGWFSGYAEFLGRLRAIPGRRFKTLGQVVSDYASAR